MFYIYIRYLNLFTKDINNNKEIKEVFKNIINIYSNEDRRIRESKRYNIILETAVINIKSRFLFIALADFNTIITVLNIQTGKSFYFI